MAAATAAVVVVVGELRVAAYVGCSVRRGRVGTCASVLFGLWTLLNGRIRAGELFDAVGRATGHE